MSLDSNLLNSLTLHSEEMSFLQFLTNLLTTVFTWPSEQLFMAELVKFSAELKGNSWSVVRVFISITNNNDEVNVTSGGGSLWVKGLLVVITTTRS